MAEPLTAEMTLARRIEMEEFVLRISARFMGVEQATLNQAINIWPVRTCAGPQKTCNVHLVRHRPAGNFRRYKKPLATSTSIPVRNGTKSDTAPAGKKELHDGNEC